MIVKMPPKTLIGLSQVCIVTDDFERTVRNLAALFNLGPWKCWDYSPPKIFDTRRSGRPGAWTMKLGVAWAGGIQLEVIQPTGGTTIYQEHLETHGPGPQHLLVRTGPSYFEASRLLAAARYPPVQSARINPAMQIGPVSLPPLPGFLARGMALQFVYHDARQGPGTVLEIAKMPPGISFELGVRLGKADTTVPAGRNGVPVSGISRIGILTGDIDRAIHSWETIGVGPWSAQPNSEARLSAARLGSVTIELAQPAGGVLRSLFDTHGPGIGYLGMSGGSVPSFTGLGPEILAENEAGTFIDARSQAHLVLVV